MNNMKFKTKEKYPSIIRMNKSSTRTESLSKPNNIVKCKYFGNLL